jgi:Beta-lactamase enzyme family
VNSLLSTNHARPISISAYSTASGVRYAVVMVPNSGANAKASWWYHGTATYIAGRLTANHARLITLQPFPGGGYVAIMVDNTGSNATGWWWYYGISGSAVTSDLTTNHARLIDVGRNSNGTYDVVMYSSRTRAYWYFGLSPAAMFDKASQLGERIVSVVTYTVNGSRFQAAAMTENLNAASQKLFNIISPKVDSGAYGFYLKQVGGSTLVSLQSTKQYEPASALKVLYHAKSIHEEALGNTTDATVITYHYHNLADPHDGDICPDDYNTTTTTNLKNADTLMMQNSDNRMTRGILEKYTKTAILNYATSLGLTSTQINHNIGCATPHNKTTLVDLGKVYEAFQNGTVTSNSGWRAEFRSRMLNETNYEPNYHNSICSIVTQEATALGKSAATATSFCNALTWIAKGGSYQYGSSFPYGVSWDGLSLTGVPYKSNGVTTPRYFVFGEFVDGTTINSQSEADAINAARSKLYQEALRPYIHAALATWT